MFVTTAPFDARAPPAAVFFYSLDRTAEHPQRHLQGYGGILQADAYAGFNRLYEAGRKKGPITEACMRTAAGASFFVLADVTAKARGKLAAIGPLALEPVKRIDLIFDIEREINGLFPEQRIAVRAALADLETWMKAERAKLSRHSDCRQSHGLHAGWNPPPLVVRAVGAH